MCYIRLAAKIGYWIVAAGFSLWYGKYAFDALEVSEEDKNKISRNPSLRWHQRWLNFLGSFVGWCLGYIALQHIYPGYKLAASDAIVLFVAFVGMTGHLPYVVKYIWKWKFPWDGE